MYKWKIERRREPFKTIVMWDGGGGEYVERSAALPIDPFRRTIPLVPHITIPRNKRDPQEFLYPNNTMNHPFTLGVVGRTVFNYSGGRYSGLAQTLEQNESYYIVTDSIVRLQDVWQGMFGYSPNKLLFTLPMPFGMYGLPTPPANCFESGVEALSADFLNHRLDILRGVNGSVYNVVNESIERINQEIQQLRKTAHLFSFV